MEQPICTIVGMASRVGLHVAKKFSREGFKVAMIGRTRFLLEKYKRKLAEEGLIAHVFVSEGESFSALEKAFEEIHSTLGKTDVLVYNESVIAQGPASEMTGESVLADLRINVAGALVSANAVIPHMKANKRGTILFTGGEFAVEPDPEYASLAIGNAGTRNLCIALAKELEPDNIHVATVTIHGLAKVQTMFDPAGVKFEPEVIAEKFYELYSQPVGQFETELVYS